MCWLNMVELSFFIEAGNLPIFDHIMSKIPYIDMTYHVISRFYMISWLYLYRGASWDQGGFIQDSDRNTLWIAMDNHHFIAG